MTIYSKQFLFSLQVSTGILCEQCTLTLYKVSYLSVHSTWSRIAYYFQFQSSSNCPESSKANDESVFCCWVWERPGLRHSSQTSRAQEYFYHFLSVFAFFKYWLSYVILYYQIYILLDISRFWRILTKDIQQHIQHFLE